MCGLVSVYNVKQSHTVSPPATLGLLQVHITHTVISRHPTFLTGTTYSTPAEYFSFSLLFSCDPLSIPPLCHPSPHSTVIFYSTVPLPVGLFSPCHFVRSDHKWTVLGQCEVTPNVSLMHLEMWLHGKVKGGGKLGLLVTTFFV